MDTEINVVDEALNLEGKARNVLTETWNISKIGSILKTTDNYLRKSGDYGSTKKRKMKIEKLVNRIFERLELHDEDEVKKNGEIGYESQRLSLPIIDESLIKDLAKITKDRNR